MNKQKLSAFFITFVIANIFFIILAFVFTKTGFSNYLTHNTKYWQDEEYYAYTFGGKGNTLLASRDNKVEAGILDLVPSVIDKIQNVSAYVSEVNNRGFAVVTTEGLLDGLVGHTVVGCPLTDLNNGLVTSGGDVNTFPTSDSCKPDGAWLNKLDADLEKDISHSVEGGGLLGLMNRGLKETFYHVDTMYSLETYANNTIREVPFIGSSVANAQADGAPFTGNMTGIFSNIAFNQTFFDLWEASRNISYFLIIIPVLAFGFAIMFRMQINPQTQITLMRAIPRFIVVMLLITFSYPLFAFIMQLLKPIIDVGTGLVWGYTGGQIPDLSYSAQQVAAFLAITGLGIPGGSLLWIVVAALGLLFLAICYFRFFLAAVTTAFKLGLMVAFGPIILVFAALPGKEGLVKNYIMTLASLVVGFAAIVLMFNLSYVLSVTIVADFTDKGLMLALFALIFSIGVLWKAPNAVKFVQQALGVQPLFGGGDEKRR